MKQFIKLSEKAAFEEIKKTGMPIKQHVDLSRDVGKRLAKELGANIEVVEAGTLLMDCVIGQAIKKGKIQDHVQMCLKKTNELLNESSLTNKDKENIRHCVLEHHGTDKFYSIESEICCNADCYRFASVKGFVYTIRYFRDTPFKDLVDLLNTKFEEKKNALTLSICNNELKNDINTIESLLGGLK